MLNTAERLFPGTFPAISRDRLSTLQVNLGYLCNQQCQHCHVNAGPRRREVMAAETVEQVLRLLRDASIDVLDLTGGAPEMNPHFRYLVRQARAAGVQVIDRCNLTVLNQPGLEGLAAFLAQQRVRVVASLPCYLRENVDAQRGSGAFEGSLDGLRRLNALGYGRAESGLRLDLVYNPQGAQLPPPQPMLEADYRERLAAYGIVFSNLLTIANMPIQRFGSLLASRGEFDAYLALLKQSHQPANLQAVMCRTMISVDWQGYLYDCDFNQMLDLPLHERGRRLHIGELDPSRLNGRAIAVADHCFGCTAGQGSSCAGALG